MTIRIPFRLIPFERRIASVYKKWLRHLEAKYLFREEFRYHATLARAEFDHIMAENDMRKAKQMLLDREERLWTDFMDPIYFPGQQEGVAFQRDPIIDDCVLDFWHPVEKAMYPKYFAKREIRKQQYIEMWEKQHGPPKPVDDH